MIEVDKKINAILTKSNLDIANKDNLFYFNFVKNINHVIGLFRSIYGEGHDASLLELTEIMVQAWKDRPKDLKSRDQVKSSKRNWYTSNEIIGMSLYVDRFAGDIKSLETKLEYFEELGVNFLHLMPIMESPESESDGGYAVSDFKTVDKRFGNMSDLKNLQKELLKKDMYLMMDIVINHTSRKHKWAEKAKKGDPEYQAFFYTYDDRTIPDQFEETMTEIFPDSSPGSFTWSAELNKWVMTVFNDYQWDLNYTNPKVFLAMVETIFFYGNIGVDILRIDAPAFIWKKLGTTCQNLDEAHRILKLFRACTDIATPGTALLGEAIVAPKEIMKYFGSSEVKECSVAYNATQMALQWDALATGETRIMLNAQSDIKQKPLGCTWINYTRCHDDIGLGFGDEAIVDAGFSAFEHRRFLKQYYSGSFQDSLAKGLLFGVNPKTQDARISGSLASLCGLETSIDNEDIKAQQLAISKIALMQANSLLLGGIPMLFYGDEVAYTNDYSYESDPGKSYDNRWAHRPLINWAKNDRRHIQDSLENQVFQITKRLIQIRKQHACFADTNNTYWIDPNNKHLIGFKRVGDENEALVLFNYSPHQILWTSFHHFFPYETYKELWMDQDVQISNDLHLITFEPYEFKIYLSK